MTVYGFKKKKVEDPWERFTVDNVEAKKTDPIVAFEMLLQYAGYNYYIFTVKED